MKCLLSEIMIFSMNGRTGATKVSLGWRKIALGGITTTGGYELIAAGHRLRNQTWREVAATGS
jgi:hypothetical protein